MMNLMLASDVNWLARSSTAVTVSYSILQLTTRLCDIEYAIMAKRIRLATMNLGIRVDTPNA
jgi:hypothetical protein